MDLISRGELKPGDHLPSERELCKDFGASRSSLREALRCLSIVGVLDARVGEGTSVANDGEKFLRKIIEWRLITEQHDIENLLVVRIALEGVSAANTARLATAEQMEKLRRIIKKMQASIDDERAYATLDLEFHLTLAEASGNTLVSNLIELVRSQLVKALHKVLVVPHALPLAQKEHRAIFEAIERHDPEAARAAMQAHLEAHLKRYSAANKGESPAGPRPNGNASNGLAKPSKTKTRRMPVRKSASASLELAAK